MLRPPLDRHAARVFLLRADAPTKPPAGRPCNGCGVCCAAVPCPVGMLVSRRREGRCRALVWQVDDHRYVCGVVASPARHLPRLLRPLSRLAARYARRLISAGTGCDSQAVVERGAAD